jgi:hypothetical protein
MRSEGKEVKPMPLSTGIFRRNPIRELEEVPQKDIDFWCGQCQFPYGEGKCKDKAFIQRCWDETGAVAHNWHLQHECPFAHQGHRCRCNDFKGMKEAFLAAGLEYKS